MTSPVVGKVTLEAGIDTDDLKRQIQTQLSKDLFKQILPQVESLNRSLGSLNAEAENLSKTSFKDLAKQVDFVADANNRVASALNTERKAQEALTKAQEKHTAAVADQVEQQRKVRSEARRLGAATDETKKKNDQLREAVRKTASAVQDELADLELASKRVNTARINDMNRYQATVERFRQTQLHSLNEIAGMEADNVRDMIRDAVNQTHAMAREEDKRFEIGRKAREKENAAKLKAWVKAEQAHIRTLDRQTAAEERARIKNEKAAAAAEAREERRQAAKTKRARRMAKEGLTSPFAVVGESMRALSGFSPMLSSGAFTLIAGGAVTAAGAVASLSQTLIALPALATTAAAGLGVLTLATSGFSDTMKAMLSGDEEKFAKEINKLGPGAQAAAMQIKALLPVLTELRDHVEGAFWNNTAPMIKGLAESYIPILDEMGTRIAGAMNSWMQEGTDFLMLPRVREQIGKITQEIGQFFENLTPMVQPLLQAFLDLTSVGMEFMPGFATNAADAAKRFADFIHEAKKSGQLHEWLQRGLDTLNVVIDAIWSLGKAFMSLAPVAEKILPVIADILEKIANFLSDHPNALYLAIAALMTLNFVGWAGKLLSSLSLMAIAFGTTLPKAIRTFTGSLAAVGTAGGRMGPASWVEKAGRDADVAAAKIESAADRSKRAQSRFASVGRGAAGGVAGIAATVGAGFLAEGIISGNMQSNDALEGYRDAAKETKDAQLDLTAALLASNGAWDSVATEAATARVSSMANEMEKASSSASSWLDNFRGADGGVAIDEDWKKWATGIPIVGGLTDMLAQPTKENEMDDAAAKWGESLKILKDKFGSELKGLQPIVTGNQNIFDMMIGNIQSSGASSEAIDQLVQKLRDLREEMLGIKELSKGGGEAMDVLVGTDASIEQVTQKVVELKEILDALPESTPIKITDDGGKELYDLMVKLGQSVHELPDGRVVFDKAPTQQFIDLLKDVGYRLEILNGTPIITKLDDPSYVAAVEKLNHLVTLKQALTGGPPLAIKPPAGPGTANLPFGMGGRLGYTPAPQTPLGQESNLPPYGQYPAGGPPPDVTQGVSESDRKKMLEDSMRAADFYKDPFATMPGSPGSAPMNVQVQNFPATYAPGGALTVPGMAGGGGGTSPLWDEIAQAESSGNWSNDNTGGHMTTSGAPRGGLQITDGTWRAFGGEEFAPTANLATKEQQIAVAERIAFTGYQGSKPQGLSAWEVVTQGKTPNVTVNTPQSAFRSTGGSNLGAGTSFSGAPYGLPKGTEIAPGGPGFDPWVYELGRQFRLKPGTYAGHQEGAGVNQGIDWTGDPADMKRFAEYMRSVQGGGVEQVIYMDPNTGEKYGAAGGKLVGPGTDQPGYYRDNWAGHTNHVHTRITKGLGQMPYAYGQDPNIMGGPNVMDPYGNMGYFETDQEAINDAAESLRDAADAQAEANRDLAVLIQLQKEGRATEGEVLDARKKVTEADEKVIDQQKKYQKTLQGDWKDLTDDLEAERKKREDYSKYPYGSLERMISGGITGGGGTEEDVAALMGPLLSAFGQPLGTATGEAVANTIKALIPNVGTPTSESTSIDKLADQTSPLLGAQAAGFNVPDYTRAGGGPQDVMANAEKIDSLGRMYSDTAALIDRSFTDMEAANKARHDQVMAVLNAIAARVGADVLQPVVAGAVTQGIQGMGNETANRIGIGVGNTAAPIIASAISRAMSGKEPMTPGEMQTIADSTIAAFLNPAPTYDEGGLWPSGTAGMNLSGAYERVLDPSATRLFDAGLLGGWNMQPMQQHMATQSGVVGNDTVGAEFFGVGQVPILGGIVNLLVRVLLSILGIEIEQRDTLNEMTDEFRDFRGDQFESFDAAGRMMNDTSAMMERSSTDEETATQERVRIFTQIMEGLINYVVKIFVDLGTSLANVGFQLLGGVAGGVIKASNPLGFLVAPFAEAAISSIGTVLTTLVGSIVTSGAGALASILLGGAAPLFAALFAPINGASGVFDDGGVAVGAGLMPKATVKPERVLSPSQTDSFDRMVAALERGGASSSTRTSTIYAPFTVQGGESAARTAHARLLQLMS